MAFAFSLPLRIAQGVLAIVVLGLMAYVVNNWTFWTWAPASANFLLFCSVWTIIALVYLIIAPLHFPVTAHKFGILAAEFLTMIFWFAGFIAVAVLLTDIGCGKHWGPCRAAEAATVFAAFEWLLFAGTTVMASVHVWRTRRTNSTSHDPQMEVRPAAYPSV